MTFTNHMLTGAMIAKFLPLPVAIPAAFASHFVLDSLPHFGYKKAEGVNMLQKHKKVFIPVISLDAVLTIALSIWLIWSKHTKWFLVGFIAASPDLVWVYRFCFKEKFGKLLPSKGNRFVQFANNIQKWERPWGVIVEIVYGLVMLAIL